MKKNCANSDAVWILKTKGPKTLIDIAQELKITTEGARFQLLKLAGEGCVKAETESKGRGRPQQIWSLTEKGHALFPDAHADLTVRIINLMRDTLGEEALETVIEANEKNGIIRYSAELEGEKNLETRVRSLAEIRDREGYMAEYFKDDEGFLLVENHCPICAAAKVCQKFCRSELNTFKTVLGKDVSVERVDHIIAGARRCAYRIKETK